VDIAIAELEAKVLPITMRRKLSGGAYFDIPLKPILKTTKKKSE